MTNRVAVLLVALDVCAWLLGSGCEPPQRRLSATASPFPPCGVEGQRCCVPLGAQAAAGLVKCGVGLGCNIVLNRCEQPCGSLAQVCCDGPDTFSPGWTVGGSPFSPKWTPLLKPMCRDLWCDPESHRCEACGQLGSPCCPPDPIIAVATCRGEGLECNYADESWTAGTCELCGGANQIACGHRCRQGLVEDDRRRCVPCGKLSQLSCDGRCDPRLTVGADHRCIPRPCIPIGGTCRSEDRCCGGGQCCDGNCIPACQLGHVTCECVPRTCANSSWCKYGGSPDPYDCTCPCPPDQEPPFDVCCAEDTRDCGPDSIPRCVHREAPCPRPCRRWPINSCPNAGDTCCGSSCFPAPYDFCANGTACPHEASNICPEGCCPNGFPVCCGHRCCRSTEECVDGGCRTKN